MTTSGHDVPLDEHLHGLEQAWGLIANAYNGNWDEAPPEWRKAAQRWRDKIWHPALKKAYPPSRSTR
jgi:hypothetical protein